MVGQRVGISDTGRKRRRNEDAYVIAPPLFAIADGMGGAQAGEIASQLAAAALEEPAGAQEGGEARVVSLIQEANRRVHQRSLEDPHASGMGTTMTVALLDGGLVWIGHVGDSRAYLFRDGRLEQLTDDHSLVAELVRSGKVSAEEAQTHPQRSVITRAVGTDPDVDVDTFPIEPREGDVFLICSDGLTDMVDDEMIRETVVQHRGDLDAAARALVGVANRQGGEDNITVIAFEISDTAADESLDETARMPSVGAAIADDEDTLSGLEPIPPVVDTMVVAAEQIRAHIAESESDRMDGIARRVLAITAVIAVVATAVVLLLWGLGN